MNIWQNELLIEAKRVNDLLLAKKQIRTNARIIIYLNRIMWVVTLASLALFCLVAA